jgi:hypothetical protein
LVWVTVGQLKEIVSEIRDGLTTVLHGTFQNPTALVVEHTDLMRTSGPVDSTPQRKSIITHWFLILPGLPQR